jgi:hypothetical protein
MMHFARGALLGLLLLAFASPVAAVVIGQVDDFEDGTTQGWVVAFGPAGGVPPAPPQVVGTGGPQGAGDGYLLLSAVGGAGPGGRLTAGNLSQWTGDYLAAGVDRIDMWVNNLGSSDLFLRLLIEDPMAGPPTNVAFSADPVAVLAGTGWQNIVFSLNQADLIAGLGSTAGALTNATVLRLFHGAADGFPGEPVVAQLGVDDIRASAAIPEPATWALMIVGFGAVGATCRRRRSPRATFSIGRGSPDHAAC